jgi:hypothetical protein
MTQGNKQAQRPTDAARGAQATPPRAVSELGRRLAELSQRAQEVGGRSLSLRQIRRQVSQVRGA